MGIKRLEKEPDHKNVYNSLINDAVGRNENLCQFACFCSAQEDRCSIALDGGWGTGKSFFLRQLQILFDAYSNHPKQLTADQLNEIRIKLDGYIKKYGMGASIHPHTCIYYDAWLNDNAEDPIRSILHEIITETDTNKLFDKKSLWQRLYRPIRSFFKKQAFSPSLLKALEALCKAVDEINPLNPPQNVFPFLKAGKAVLPFLEYFKKNNPVQEIDIQKRFHNAFEDYLDEAITDKNSRLLVLIDELDRCKPTYAVQLLERIKHYLSNKRITFVFAINEDQLQHTVKIFYGTDFNAHRYLDRFFDFRLSLPQPDVNRFYNSYGLNPTGGDFDARLYADVCIAFARVYDLSLRESMRYWQWVKLACHSFKEQEERNNSFNWKFIMYIIVPLVLGLKLLNRQLFESFINGEDSNPLKKLLCNSPIAHRFINSPEEAMKETSFSNQLLFLDALTPVDEIYKALFRNNKEQGEIDPQLFETAPFKFTKEMVNTIHTASNFMADFIKFDTNTEETAHG